MKEFISADEFDEIVHSVKPHTQYVVKGDKFVPSLDIDDANLVEILNAINISMKAHPKYEENRDDKEWKKEYIKYMFNALENRFVFEFDPDENGNRRERVYEKDLRFLEDVDQTRMLPFLTQFFGSLKGYELDRKNNLSFNDSFLDSIKHENLKDPRDGHPFVKHYVTYRAKRGGALDPRQIVDDVLDKIRNNEIIKG